MLDGRFQVERLRTRLDQAYQRYSQVPSDPELQADFARYLCVLTSGYVEQAVYILFQEYCRKRTNGRLFRYAASRLEQFQNPTTEKLARLVGDFDPTWKQEFETFTDGERKESLNSIVAIRHQVAHGESVGTTYRHLLGHRPRIDETIEWLTVLVSRPG